MKKIVTPLLSLVLCISILSLEGCKKVWDYIKHHDEGPATNCRIDHIIFPIENNMSYDPNPFMDTLNITYDRAGNPLKMSYAFSKVQLEWQWGWAREKRFRCDDKNRLVVFLDGVTSYTMSSDHPFTTFWHHFTYINDHLIRDTVYEYVMGEYLIHDKPDGVEGTGYYNGVAEYVLDDYGRIIKVTDIGNTGFDRTEGVVYYTYDARGNAIKPGVSYSNMININQTHKAWMLLSREYSVNAPLGEAIEYNENRLPVSYKDDAPFFFAARSYTPFDELSRVYYECKR